MRPAVRILISMIWFVCNTMTFATTTSEEHFNNRHMQQRYETLLRDIRCVVCHQQNLAESEAALAMDLRHKIFDLLQAKQSDEEIKAYLVARYGNAILLQPPLMAQTVILWGFPLLGLLLVFLTLLRLSKKPADSQSDVLG